MTPALSPSAKPSLRTMALRTETSLQRSVSFVSMEERIPRKSFVSAAGGLPSSATVHLLRRSGHSFVVVTISGFEETFANRFLEEVCAAFADVAMAYAQSCGGRQQPNRQASVPTGESSFWRRAATRRQAAAEDDLGLPNFAPRLEALLIEHGKTERLARLRRIRSIESAAQDVAIVVEEAVDNLLATSQNLEALEDKSEWLLAQATIFRRKARSTRCRSCRRNLKLTICLALVALVTIAMGTLLVLQYAGVIHLLPSGSSPPAPPSPSPAAHSAPF